MASTAVGLDFEEPPCSGSLGGEKLPRGRDPARFPLHECRRWPIMQLEKRAKGWTVERRGLLNTKQAEMVIWFGWFRIPFAKRPCSRSGVVEAAVALAGAALCSQMCMLAAA